MTELLYRDDAYLAEAEAVVRAAGPEGIELDRTIFYASSGGQPGDTGRLSLRRRPAGGDRRPSIPTATAAASCTSSPRTRRCRRRGRRCGWRSTGSGGTG